MVSVVTVLMFKVLTVAEVRLLPVAVLLRGSIHSRKRCFNLFDGAPGGGPRPQVNDTHICARVNLQANTQRARTSSCRH